MGTGNPVQGKPCTPSASSSAGDADLRLGVGRQPFAAVPFPALGVVPLSAWDADLRAGEGLFDAGDELLR